MSRTTGNRRATGGCGLAGTGRAGRRQQGGKAAGRRGLRPLALAFACAVLLASAALGGCGRATVQSSIWSAAEQIEVVQDKTPRTVPSKLEGAQETIDENGIVHGVAANGVRYDIYGRGVQTLRDNVVGFAAVGDIMSTDSNMVFARGYGQVTGHGEYYYLPFYRGVTDLIGGYDLRFANDETMCAGTEDGHSYEGYPLFNSPDAHLEAQVEAGFNIIQVGSNHTWDQGAYGIEYTHRLLSRWPQIMVTGGFLTPEERDTVHMVERNGADIAVLGYTYADNQYASPESFPNLYYSCPFDMQAMATDIERAQTVADAVVVYVHWGDEYNYEISAQQAEYAQFLADMGVDLVVGSHAHILQTARYVTGSNGNKTLVVYGLSDFVSGWNITDTILSAVFTCDFEWTNQGLALTNPALYPSIEWSDGGDVYVRLLKDMGDDEINANTRTPDVGDDVSYFANRIQELGFEIPVVIK